MMSPFALPNVPPGTYELRLGYPAMEDRGIAQIYLDGVPQGIPIDMRFRANDPRVEGLYNGLSGDRNSDESSMAYIRQNNWKKMHEL